ncbi:hypothetical protein GRJ2_001407700 [Grus japonensis]|uniref:Uncharacterized protein n=1 Tax=Grus japonensis TaxID=30415 RepID=A0ABC9WVK2_GRUJA
MGRALRAYVVKVCSFVHTLRPITPATIKPQNFGHSTSSFRVHRNQVYKLGPVGSLTREKKPTRGAGGSFASTDSSASYPPNQYHGQKAQSSLPPARKIPEPSSGQNCFKPRDQ